MAKWLVTAKKADFNGIGERFHIHPVTARIIRNRDVIEEGDIQLYLNGNKKDFYSPKLLKDAEKMVSIIQEKIAQKKLIQVIGDYDIDGVMATYILVAGLKRCGAKVSTQIPDRIHDGYGLNRQLIQSAKNDGVDTIITCDNGISAIDEIAFAKEMGMTVLVTDHHAIPYEEIDGVRVYKTSVADAIVNPHQQDCSYPYKELCGAAVAWKVISLLYEAYDIPQEEAEDFLENVAFATVGDVMPLKGENRILVKEGLKRIRKTKNQGMRALIAQCDLEPEQVTAGRIGFRLGPCINASGRLDTAKRALELFFQTTSEKALIIANELVVLNNERKALTEEGIEEAIAYYEEHQCEQDRVIVIYLPNVHESIAGIIAGRIRERYYKPTFILTDAEDGSIKGSGRSIEEYSMYEEMCKCQELFLKFGGHPMAAGLSLPKENVLSFRKEINRLCTLTEEELTEKIRIDVPMPIDYATPELLEEFAVLEPFGKDNARPVFADKGVRIRRMWTIGKNNDILKFDFLTKNNNSVSGIRFRDNELFLQYLEEKFGKEQVKSAFLGKPNTIELSMIYNPEINSFRGVDTIQIIVEHYQ
ncbi:MAG: single-stranded-DNA-specific exonuclease RecJ [Agathobacter sp.]|nr:single-stranded-DNA-specific exonuclease RecJ [Agathobacter sp.]